MLCFFLNGDKICSRINIEDKQSWININRWRIWRVRSMINVLLLCKQVKMLEVNRSQSAIEQLHIAMYRMYTKDTSKKFCPSAKSSGMEARNPFVNNSKIDRQFEELTNFTFASLWSLDLLSLFLVSICTFVSLFVAVNCLTDCISITVPAIFFSFDGEWIRFSFRVCVCMCWIYGLSVRYSPQRYA